MRTCNSLNFDKENKGKVQSEDVNNTQHFKRVTKKGLPRAKRQQNDRVGVSPNQ